MGEAWGRPTGRTEDQQRRVSSYHEPTNRWTTSESSSPEPEEVCRKHSGVSEKDFGYQLLEGDADKLDSDDKVGESKYGQ